jgi:glycerophosphoryl diester phosphodiesterase
MPQKLINSSYVGLHRPTIFAHRGSSTYAPENTLAAFKLAIDQGADAIELDAQLTTDDRVVVIHDLIVDRTTDGSGRVNRMSLSELQKLDAGSRFNPSFKGEKIPSLEQVFDAVGKQIFIDIEIKNYASPIDRLPLRVADLVRNYGLEQSVLLSSFNPIALVHVHQLMPDVPLGLITIKGKRGALFRSWLGRYIPHQALHPAWNDVTPALVSMNHRHGYRVHPYVVNDPTLMGELLDASVDGIFTGDPPLALQVIAKKKEMRPGGNAPA